MGDRAGVWLRRASSPAALLSLLVVLLLGVGAAAAFAKRSSGPDVTLEIAHTPAAEASTPPATPRTEGTPLPAPSPPSAGSAAAGAPSPTASPRPTGPPSTATPAILATPVAPPTLSPTPAASGAAPIIQLPISAGIGEAFAMHVFAPGATSVAVELNGASYSAAAIGDRFWLILGTSVTARPGPRPIRAVAYNAAGTAVGSSQASILYTFVEHPVDYLETTAEQSSVLTEEAGRVEAQLRIAQFAHFEPARRWVGRFARPLFGAQTTAFGQGRSINGGPIGGYHTGMDIAGDRGDPVRAAAAGVVFWVGEMPIRGRSVIIDHGAGVKSGYHHLDATLISVGATVEAGHVVGTVGSTGFSTGPHLHWEVTVWGVNVDPLQWTTASFDP